ncbi:MAG: DUF5053 domain-containing protein [Bacteroidetes bacterium]|nr:DUF5053 domain-containing protein [Bacteroidota bacterium]
MKQKIEELKNRFINATTDAEKDAIDREMDALVNENQTDFETAMLLSIKETNAKVEENILKNRLEEVLPAISVSYLAKQYFRKTPQWFYQRLNRNTVNGKSAKFTTNELKTLATALTDISNKINKSVAFVV